MSDERQTTTDALAYLQRAVAVEGDTKTVDAVTLAIAVRELALLRARVSALEAALRDCLRVLDGVAAGESSIAPDIPASLMAEMRAHYNGYEGGPDITRTAARVRELLGGDACAR